MQKLKKQLHNELTGNILPFWMNKMTDDEQGGYYGQMTGANVLIKKSPKGGILNARILWTFSSAALHLKNEEYLKYAERVKNYILSYFFDKEHGGTYWMLNADGTPLDTKKQIYSQAFFIYALVEYYRVTNDEECLEKAIELFHLIEKHSFDNDQNGYFEAYSCDWNLLNDLRLSEKDANEKKTMNTHLHILEAYANLFRVWKNDFLEKQLKNLIEIFTDNIINPETNHLDLFFDENWTRKSTLFSYGHDIEASWLLYEAAEILGDKALLNKVEQIILKVADASTEGLLPDGSLASEKDYSSGHVDKYREWWPQAEAMVGYYNAYQLAGNESYLERVQSLWKYICDYIVDEKNGEWHWGVFEDGVSIDTEKDKAGFWKCPYHNSRMCLELIERID